MGEGREILRSDDGRSGCDKRRDDDRWNATPVHVEVKTVCRSGEEIAHRRDVWTRRHCIFRNARWNDVIVHTAALVVSDDQERRLPILTVAQSIIELQKKSLAVSHVNGWIVVGDDQVQIA